MIAFKKILIANRGEIALRIIRSCKKRGIKTIVVYAPDDQNRLIKRNCDKYVKIDGDSLEETYLNISRMVSLAKRLGCDAIHPGYGFQSENPDFPKICNEEGIVFIGPSLKTLSAASNNIVTRDIAESIGISVLPVSDVLSDHKVLKTFYKKHGLPLMIKPVFSGGGKNIKAILDKKMFDRFLREDKDLLKNPDKPPFFAQKMIRGRHIEFQFLRDRFGQSVIFPERECSIQRRFQKIIEESPSVVLSSLERRKAQVLVRKLIDKIDFVGAGTIEFLFTPRRKFYFLEINPRIQVEHGVSELVTNIDIVDEQIRIAEGRHLRWKQSDIRIKHHAIECRILAENIRAGFRPFEGTIDKVTFPSFDFIRMDSAIFDGYKISTVYDSLLAKIMVVGKTRKAAVDRMVKALDSFKIKGVPNSIAFSRMIIDDSKFRRGLLSTTFLQDNKMIEKFIRKTLSPKTVASIAAAIFRFEAYNNLDIKDNMKDRKNDGWPKSDWKKIAHTEQILHEVDD